MRSLLESVTLAFFSFIALLFSVSPTNAGESTAKFGVIDTKGRFVLQPKYPAVKPFTEGLAAVQLPNQKWGFIDLNGNFAIQPKFDGEPGLFSEGLCTIWVHNGRTFIDKTGAKPFDAVFENACGFSEGLAAVELNNKWGYIDHSGRIKIAPKFDYAWSFSEGLAGVKVDGKVGFINKCGAMVIPPKYYWTYCFQNGIASVQYCALWRDSGVGWGVIDKTGKELIAPGLIMDGESISDGLYRTSPDASGKYGFCDSSGKLIIPKKFELDFAKSESSSGFTEGLAVVKVNGKFGYIDKTGKIVIEPQFDTAGSFGCGLADVSIHGRSGYIDKTGRLVIPLRFKSAGTFWQQRATVIVP